MLKKRLEVKCPSRLFGEFKELKVYTGAEIAAVFIENCYKRRIENQLKCILNM